VHGAWRCVVGQVPAITRYLVAQISGFSRQADRSSYTDVAPAVTGELSTRGYSVLLGNWGDPERTREVLDAAG
jgi:long-subunit acyl-CoA synthetase (AMP-forming)